MRLKKELQAEPRASPIPPKCRCVAEGQGNSSDLCPYKIHPSASLLNCKYAVGCISQTGHTLELKPHAPDLPKILAEAEIKLLVDTSMHPGRSAFMLLICHQITTYSKTEALQDPAHQGCIYPLSLHVALGRTPMLHLAQGLLLSLLQHNTLSTAASPTQQFWWQDRSSAPLQKQRREVAAALPVAQTRRVPTGHLP